MVTSTVTSKGQTTIPKGIRDELGIQANQRISYEAKDGYIIMRPLNTSLDHFAGILKSNQPAASKQVERHAVSRALGEKQEPLR